MIYIYVVSLALVALKLYQKVSIKKCKCKVETPDQTVIVTGANTGIGYETAKDLARRGLRVILACRSTEKGIAARDKIIKSTGNNSVIFKHLDLTSLNSVRAFANDILETEPQIHVLINNAGIGIRDNSLTEDNLPIELQVNYFGPFLLTGMLLPLLKLSAPSRIVNVSSCMHCLGNIDPKSFGKQVTTYIDHKRLYCDSKLATILFTNKLSRELRGKGVTVNSLDPGGVSTGLLRDKNFLIRLVVKLWLLTPYEGAQTSIHLAVSPKLANVTGKYFYNCAEARIAPRARDMDLARKIWKVSERAVNWKLN